VADGGSGQSAGGAAFVALVCVIVGLGGAISLGWVAYLQAFTLPLITPIGAWIAARQMLIADGKLRLDSFIHQYSLRQQESFLCKYTMEKQLQR
jgi:hypothetical protein